MRQKFTAIFFLLLFAAPQINKLLVVADYYTNTSSYAKDCVNKYRPRLHCNGKCQLMKKLKEQEKKEQRQNIRTDFKNEIVSSKSFCPVLPLISVSFLSALYREWKNPYSSSLSFEIFHPPSWSC